MKTKMFLRSISLILVTAIARAGVTAPPLANAPSKNEPGLILSLSAGGKTDTRPARMVSLYVPAGQPVSPFLPAGAFTAKWEGEIVSELRADCTFSAVVKGTFKLTINGQPVFDGAGGEKTQLVKLNKGGNKLVAELSADGASDAMLQLKWSSREFPAEPLPPMAVQRNGGDTAMREGQRIREGRMLFAQLRCSGCHDSTGLVPPRGEGMPELDQSAPMFGELGAKFKENYLAHWINDPHSIRPHTLMPRVFADGKPGEVDPRAADLAAYFASLGKRDETGFEEDQAPVGGALFANLGCIACHTPPDFEGDDEHKRIPLAHVKAKWQPIALRNFLKDPAKEYPHVRMPNFRLSDEEAERLASYLLVNAKREFPAGPKGDATKGGALLVTAGCISCHAGGPMMGAPKLADTLAGTWEKGCLAPDATARGKAPDFAFDDGQRAALRAFAAQGLDSLKRDVPSEFAERQISNLRCTACHGRDGQQSVWSKVEGDMIALQSAAPAADAGDHAPVATTAIPTLTWLGEKLHPAWSGKFIAGEIKDKPRPWIIGRMPGFGKWAQGIADGLSYEHGFALTETPTKVDPAKAKIGEQLIGESGGFNCIQCHGLGDRPATAPFEAPATNLGTAPERLRHEYFSRWLLHPLRIDPETKMPRFADDEGLTQLRDVLDGKGSEQFDAIWQYLQSPAK